MAFWSDGNDGGSCGPAAEVEAEAYEGLFEEGAAGVAEGRFFVGEKSSRRSVW